jgi:glutathione peroxidase-family protein
MNESKQSSFFDYTALDSKAKEYPLAKHKNHPVLVVNVASK